MSKRAIALVISPSRDEALDAARKLASLLEKEGFALFTISDVEIQGVTKVAPDALPDIESAVALGGDGTILRAAEITLLRDIPLLGINLGHVGFMAEVARPTIEAIGIAIKERRNLTADEAQKCEDYLKEIENTRQEKTEVQWLVDKTEKFCQEKAIYNAVLGSISILDGKDKNHDKGQIPKILSDALAISFDNSVGHDYLQDSDERFEFYHRTEERIPFDLEYFNKITKGGLPNKTLNIALAGTGVGKSLFMCHCAAGAMVQGKNVLYLTLEMSEEKIAERIDANLLNVTVDDLMDLPILQCVGFSAAPSDGIEDVFSSVDYVCKNGGGRGCVREVIDMILKSK